MRIASKFNPSAIKLFFVILYGEHEFIWIRRHGFRFALEVRPTVLQFGCRSVEQATEMFKHLVDLGWIYHFRKDKFTYRFTVRPPHWLGLSETAPLTERYVDWDRKYDGEDDRHITYEFIQALRKSYPERKAAFDNLQQVGVESDVRSGPKTVDEILSEE